MPIFGFGFTILFIGLFGYINLNASGEANEAFRSALIGVVSLQVLSMSINTVPQAISDYRNSVLMKRIGSTPIRPWMFLITISLFYSMMMILIILWALLWIAIWFNQYVNEIFVNANTDWGSFAISFIYMVITAIFIGILVMSLSKSVIASNAIGMIIFFISMFLSGTLFPLTSIVGDNPKNWLNILSYFSPFRYTNGLVSTSWMGHSIFVPYDNISIDVTGQPSKIIYYNYDFYLNWFMPLVFIAISLALSIKTFRWASR